MGLAEPFAGAPVEVVARLCGPSGPGRRRWQVWVATSRSLQVWSVAFGRMHLLCAPQATVCMTGSGNLKLGKAMRSRSSASIAQVARVEFCTQLGIERCSMAPEIRGSACSRAAKASPACHPHCHRPTIISSACEGQASAPPSKQTSLPCAGGRCGPRNSGHSPARAAAGTGH